MPTLAGNSSRQISEYDDVERMFCTGRSVPSYERLSGKCFKGMHARELIVYNVLLHAFREAFAT